MSRVLTLGLSLSICIGITFCRRFWGHGKVKGIHSDDVEDAAGADEKCTKGPSNDVSGPLIPYGDRQLQRSNEETASVRTLDQSGSSSSFKLKHAKHKIFLSHAGVQKDFTDRLCVDLERQGYLFPFFDQRHYSLPKGKDYVPIIKDAARTCLVAVVVLSKEFMSSKWPMIELAEFYAARKAAARPGERKLEMLPLFYKLSVDDLNDQTVETRWMPKWIDLKKADKRIDLEQWRAAVKQLRRDNGLVFGTVATSEVEYRKRVVRSVFTLAPPDLLYGSSKSMVGYNRMCQEVSSQFVRATMINALVLGLYGTTGLGKSTLCKGLCDYFYGDFSGRVCYVDFEDPKEDLGYGIGEAMKLQKLKLEPQKLMLKKLCGFENDVLDPRSITDYGQGLNKMQEHMCREPVFLVIDNVTTTSEKEARDYLTVRFHSESRIVITSRSHIILQDLLPGVQFCKRMPSLSEEEAEAVFFRSASPMVPIDMLTDDDRRVLRLCIQDCFFRSDGDGLNKSKWSYHPLALSALGDYLQRKSRNLHMLVWKDHLEKDTNMLKNVLSKSSDIFKILDLQLSTFQPSVQLLFLDLAVYGMNWLEDTTDYFQQWVQWLCELHEFCNGDDEKVLLKDEKDMKDMLWELARSGMIVWNEEEIDEISVHALYREFAEWYVRGKVNELKSAWVVFQRAGTSLSATPSCWSDLVRLRASNLTREQSRFVKGKAMEQLSNLVLLQLQSSTNLTELNLKGLNRLRHLELVNLPNLVKVTLTGNASTDEDVDMYYPLRSVKLEDLDSLKHMPDFRSCSHLRTVIIKRCFKLTNFKAIECPELNELRLWDFPPDQFRWLPNFKYMAKLEVLKIRAVSDVDMCAGLWVMEADCIAGVENFEVDLEDAGQPCLRLLEKLLSYIPRWKKIKSSFDLHRCLVTGTDTYDSGLKKPGG